MKLKEKFEKLGLSTDNLTARIEGFNKSDNGNGLWYIMSIIILDSTNHFHRFIAKLCAGINNEEYIERTIQFFDTFQKGDYHLTGVELRNVGDTWVSEDGKSNGTYKESYIYIPFTSRMIFIGENGVQSEKILEAQYARLQYAELVEE
jgi:hypothetical protein